jgi:anaerobic ribonucleoside-triphosphate reductase activating protein
MNEGSLTYFPVKGFIETSFLDWKDHLSSVFFTGGCNFRCPFCHNSDLVLNHDRLLDIPEEQILGNLRKFRKWIDRVVVTGGEPTLQKGLPVFAERLKREGYKVKLDTNGSHPEVIKDLVSAGLIDCIAMDIKGPITGYDRWCGTTVDRDKIEESIDFQGRGCEALHGSGLRSQKYVKSSLSQREILFSGPHVEDTTERRGDHAGCQGPSYFTPVTKYFFS